MRGGGGVFKGVMIAERRKNAERGRERERARGGIGVIYSWGVFGLFCVNQNMCFERGLERVYLSIVYFPSREYGPTLHHQHPHMMRP